MGHVVRSGGGHLDPATGDDGHAGHVSPSLGPRQAGPIILGGKAAKRGARLAAVYADEYNTPDPSVDEVIELADEIA
jgi:alkanesulfonate monooxygenase SsuD/methylene tetrahydromethanopterin reductase-like flavin-dependent oxidoreductase (luciferase family)